MIRRTWFIGALACGVGFTASPCFAETRAPLTWHADPVTAERPTGDQVQKDTESRGAGAAIDKGQVMPFTVGAAAPVDRAQVTALGGYDSAANTGRARSAAEVRTFDFLTLRLDYEHGPGTGSDDRLTVGARATFLRQDRHGLDMGAGFFYQAKDFRGEGNFIAALLAGRSFGRLSLFANTLFGMDSEGDDASLELRLSGMYRVNTALHFGLDARGRKNFSDDEKRHDAQEVQWDGEGGALAMVNVGPVALTGLVGPRVLVVAAPEAPSAETRVGVLAMGGAAAVF